MTAFRDYDDDTSWLDKSWLGDPDPGREAYDDTAWRCIPTPPTWRPADLFTAAVISTAVVTIFWMYGGGTVVRAVWQWIGGWGG